MEKEIIKIVAVSPTIGTAPLMKIIEENSNDNEFILISLDSHDIDITEEAAKRMHRIARDNDAALVYSDYRVQNPDRTLSPHPLAPYQPGSVRDDFDFGPLILVNIPKIIVSDSSYGDTKPADSLHSGLYALRLYYASKYGCASIIHIPEYLYVSSEVDRRASGEKQFDYVNPRNAAVQKEREQVFTEYLHDISAFLPPADRLINPDTGEFPVEASVIIPVRDRARTITDAVESALSQEADFDFNVIAVDNHSTDGTTDILAGIASKDPRVVHLIPSRDDLGIGGCWDLAIRDPRCGRFAIQLDSDDKYKDATTLAKIVDCFRRERCAMVIGSYELTDFDGNPIPPGLIDHKEWTPENGHNNALRINGLGAPRAFHTPVLREIGVPNVSYGEDYALGLRISREYKIGRIYESLYLCRRWQGNSDANLSQDRVNANNIYKDWLRTIEIAARKKVFSRIYNDPTLYNREINRKLSKFIGDQLEKWPLAAKNFNDLGHVEMKSFNILGCEIQARFNPARAISSGAKTDAASIAARACFLCKENRPECQDVYPILEGYSLLVNPYPLFKTHCTIVSETHQPQRVNVSEPDGSSRYSTMFDLCCKMPGWVIFYNGPKCGASAPDHLHFQAFNDDQEDPFLRFGRQRSNLPYQHYFFHAEDKEQLNDKMSKILEEISGLTENHTEDEPKINLFMKKSISAGHTEEMVDVLVIPRRAHRPSCYGKGENDFMISPGAVDVYGSLVVSRKEDFDRLDSHKVEEILRETTYFTDVL